MGIMANRESPSSDKASKLGVALFEEVMERLSRTQTDSIGMVLACNRSSGICSI